MRHGAVSDRKANAEEARSQLKPALWGAVAGAGALAIVGFTWGGWVTGGKADVLARQQVEARWSGAYANLRGQIQQGRERAG
jgi:hypothetical protein